MSEIPCFVINLKKDTEKRLRMTDICSSTGIIPIFIDAVYGKDLDTHYIDIITNQSESIRSYGKPLTSGEVGCALSHLLIYKRMVDEQIKYALILEDDIIFTQAFIPFIQKFETIHRSLVYDIVLLGHHSSYSIKTPVKGSFWGREKIAGKLSLQKPIEQSYGTYGYIININCAQRLLNELKTIVIPIDYTTGNHKKLDLFLVNSPVVDIDDYSSENLSCLSSERDSLNQLYIKKIAKSFSKLQMSINKFKYHIKTILRQCAFLKYSSNGKI